MELAPSLQDWGGMGACTWDFASLRPRLGWVAPLARRDQSGKQGGADIPVCAGKDGQAGRNACPTLDRSPPCAL